MLDPAPRRGHARVAANRCEGGPNWRVRLEPERWPGSAPGQFVMLTPGIASAALRFDPLLPRPMAVFRGSRDEGWFEVLYKVTGRGTQLLAETRVGDRVGWVGPLGQPFADPPRPGTAVLVGGGTGIASLYDLARRLAPTRPTRVALGARTRQDLMAEEDFAALGCELSVATEDGSAGHTGLVTELLTRCLDAPAAGASPVVGIYACGPTAMMAATAELAAAADVACWVSLENHMACGFGVCLGCAVPASSGGFELVCRDGPVFSASDVAWSGLP